MNHGKPIQIMRNHSALDKILAMNSDEAKRILGEYNKELKGILSRFKETRDSIYIDNNDDPRYRQIVTEIRDFIDDILGQNSYSTQIVSFFNEGISNFTGSPSYKSVENIHGLVASIITRIERNPQILTEKSNASYSRVNNGDDDLACPPKITLLWLAKNVPITFWLWLAGLLLTAFIAGITFGQLSLVKELIGIRQEKYPSTPNEKLTDRKTEIYDQNVQGKSVYSEIIQQKRYEPEPNNHEEIPTSTLTSQEVSLKVEKSIEEEDYDNALSYVWDLPTGEERDEVRKRIFDKLIKSQKSQKLDDAKKVVDQFELQYNKDKANKELGKEYLKK
jgi:hypothetical protein